MLVVAFSVTATTTGIAILGFHATVITLRVLASLVMNHADFLAMDAFAALTAVVAFVAVPAVLAIVLVTAFGTGFGLTLLLGRRALLFRILLFAGLPIGLATLIGTLDGAPLAIVGSTLFAGFGTLLLMQRAYFSRRLLLRFSSCFSRFSSWISGCSQRCSRASYSRLSRPSNLAARRSARFCFGSKRCSRSATSARSSRPLRFARSLRSDLNGLPPLSLPRSLLRPPERLRPERPPFPRNRRRPCHASCDADCPPAGTAQASNRNAVRPARPPIPTLPGNRGSLRSA